MIGRALGSVGIGNIGAEMFRLAKPFDMHFIAHDPYVNPALARELGITLVDLDTVFRESVLPSIVRSRRRPGTLSTPGGSP
jgi:phosphoglycerate dehydrogenase-like enzyme